MKKHKKTEKSSIFAYCKEFCSLKGRPRLTSEYYLPCRKFREEYFQAKNISCRPYIDRGIYAKNRRKPRKLSIFAYLWEYAITSTKFLGRWLGLG